MRRPINAVLYELAEVGWAERVGPARQDFLLTPASLPPPSSVEALSEIVRLLYSHARKWAPGFQVPFAVPDVKWGAPTLDLNREVIAGAYRVDTDGYVHIDVSPKFYGQSEALLAILAHEACHHILDLSGVRGNTVEEDERLCELSGFICGFGLLTLNGCRVIRNSGPAREETHLGYLSIDEYQAAHEWVIKVQLLDLPDAGTGFKAQTLAGGGSGSVLRRILRTLWHLIRPEAANSSQQRKPSGLDGPMPTFSSEVDRKRKQALTRLAGDRKKLERLLEYELQRHPHATESELLQMVMENLERDRR
jgi:hypothetical protein